MCLLTSPGKPGPREADFNQAEPEEDPRKTHLLKELGAMKRDISINFTSTSSNGTNNSHQKCFLKNSSRETDKVSVIKPSFQRGR